jgi:hypothetical protein
MVEVFFGTAVAASPTISVAAWRYTIKLMDRLFLKTDIKLPEISFSPNHLLGAFFALPSSILTNRRSKYRMQLTSVTCTSDE